MAITKVDPLTRIEKGSALSYLEMDSNIANTATAVNALIDLQVPNLKALAGITPKEGVTYLVQEFNTGTGIGAFSLKWDATRAWTSAEIGLVYPNVALNAWNGTAAGIATLYGSHGSGVGCWVRVHFKRSMIFAAMYNTSVLDLPVESFGGLTGLDSSLSLQAAINAFAAVNDPSGAGGEMSIGGVEIKLGSGLYIFNDVLPNKNITISGQGMGVTTVKRTLDTHVFKVFGPAFNGSPSTLPWWGVNLKDMTITTELGLETYPLVEWKGVTSSKIENVRFIGYGTNLLTLHQVWDSRFNFCEFLGGGRGDSDPTPIAALLFRSGYGYRQTKESFFHQCRWEAYDGQAIGNDSEADEGGKKTELLGFSQCKLESKNCFQRHINLYLVSQMWFDQFYVTTNRTPNTEPVVNLGGGQNYSGNITVFFSADANLVFPKSAVRVLGANDVNLTVTIGALQPSTMWAVDWDGSNPSDTNFDIFGPYPTVNGRYQSQKTFNNTTVRQAGTATDAVQYVYAKSGRPEWSQGNPANPSGTIEESYYRANGVNMVTYRCSTAEVATAFRSMIPNAHMILGKGYLAPNQLRLSEFTFWVDSQSRLRRAPVAGDGYPASDTAGFFFQTNKGGNTASAPTSPDLFEQYTNNQTNELWIWFGTAWRKIATTPV